MRKTPRWPRRWASFSLLHLHSHENAWANLHILGQRGNLTPFSLGRSRCIHGRSQVMAINSGHQPGSLSVSAELSCGVETAQPRHDDTATVCAHGPLNLMCLLKDHSSFKGMPCTSSGLDGAPLLRPWPYALHPSPGERSPHLRLRRASLCPCATIIHCRTAHTNLRCLLKGRSKR